MDKIEIFLILNEGQIPFLSIPRSDVKRLAVSPFRWIRYVMFAICGAEGNLFTKPDPDGLSVVDYDRTELPAAGNTYYYRPSEDCAFVDHEGLNERMTSTAQTPRSNTFRANVMRRDGGFCVVSQQEASACDAAHLIPHCKGDEYIAKVIHLRSPRDNSAPPSNVEMDDMVNGMFLGKEPHALLGKGKVAFIKTPNYGLRPEDIEKVQRGPGPDYITLHRLKEPTNYDPALLATLQNVHPSVALALGANVDALFQGEGGSPPSTVILDYVYGVAAYNSWRSNRGNVDVMGEYRKIHYANIKPPSRAPPDDIDDASDPDETSGTEYQPRRTLKSGPRERKRDESDLAKAMDELNVVLMYIHGITPGEAAKRRQKEIEQEERAAQEAGRRKVMEWRKHMDVH